MIYFQVLSLLGRVPLRWSLFIFAKIGICCISMPNVLGFVVLLQPFLGIVSTKTQRYWTYLSYWWTEQTKGDSKTKGLFTQNPIPPVFQDSTFGHLWWCNFIFWILDVFLLLKRIFFALNCLNWWLLWDWSHKSSWRSLAQHRRIELDSGGKQGLNRNQQYTTLDQSYVFPIEYKRVDQHFATLINQKCHSFLSPSVRKPKLGNELSI